MTPPLVDMDSPLLDDAGLDIGETSVSVIELLNSHALVFVAAFMVTLLATPIVRRLAIASGVVDRPDEARKLHRRPIPYLGGVAVFFGIMVAVAVSYASADQYPPSYLPVPLAVVLGMGAITFTGLADDVWGWDPRLKIAGQLVAAAGLAISNVGVDVAVGLLQPIFGASDAPLLGTVADPIVYNRDLYYWVGTALIAVFVLGGCNAANFIDGLDGLLSGVTSIVAVSLLAICLLIAVDQGSEPSAEGSMSGARIVLCLALLGATMGFLPHNFNPASIFLGDCGSLLLGYMCVVIILMLERSHLVFAGLIVFAVPIMDTTLAIIRRKLAGVPMSAADDQHMHHQLRRGLGGVKRAVFAMYAMAFAFGTLGVTLAALVMRTGMRVRMIYAIALVLFGFIGVIAVKAARRAQIEKQEEQLAKQTIRKVANGGAGK